MCKRVLEEESFADNWSRRAAEQSRAKVGAAFSSAAADSQQLAAGCPTSYWPNPSSSSSSRDKTAAASAIALLMHPMKTTILGDDIDHIIFTILY